MSFTIFLTVDHLLTIHEDQVERYGGEHGLRDLALLESAIMRPQATFGGEELYPSLFLQAAALMHSLILNHAFVDANKRSGTAATVVFLELNEYILDVGDDALVQAALSVASKEWDIDDIAQWLKKHSKKKRK